MCGYELSNLYYQLRSAPVSYQDTPMINGLLDKDDNDTYMGQLVDESILGEWPLVAQEHGKYIRFSSSSTNYIGKLLPVEIANGTHYLAIMLPENVYNEMLASTRTKAVAIFGLILLLFIAAGYLINKKYVEPIVGDLQQLRLNPLQKPSSDLQELDEVFTAWQNSSYQNKDMPPIDEDSYNMFVNNLSQLTTKERAIFDLYLAGLVPKEVTAKLGITENTIKYHNKNIYGKLGVKSRKELLQCVKYMRLLERK